MEALPANVDVVNKYIRDNPDRAREDLKGERRRRVLAGDFLLFCKVFWDAACGRPFLDSEHVRRICARLQQWAETPGDKLVICIPPGHGKSTIASVLLPAWIWLRSPEATQICVSHSRELATRDVRRTRRIFDAPLWSALRTRWRFKRGRGAMDTVSHYENTVRGYRRSFGVRSGATGWRGRYIFFDDLLDAMRPIKRTRINEAIGIIRNYVSTRQEGEVNALLIMQRVAKDDPAQVVVEEDGWDLLKLPAEYDPADPSPYDWRTEKGEPLCPAIYSTTQIEYARTVLTPQIFEFQFNQRNSPEGGNIWKSNRFRYYQELPKDRAFIFQSWDLTFKSATSRVACTVWAAYGRSMYLLHARVGKWDFVQSLQEVLDVSALYPKSTIVVENKANGEAMLSVLKAHNDLRPYIQHWDPSGQGDKAQRAHAVQPHYTQGLVFHPDPSKAPWLKEYEAELCDFDGIKDQYDDYPDSTTQALIYKLGSAYDYLRQLLTR